MLCKIYIPWAYSLYTQWIQVSVETDCDITKIRLFNYLALAWWWRWLDYSISVNQTMISQTQSKECLKQDNEIYYIQNNDNGF